MGHAQSTDAIDAQVDASLQVGSDDVPIPRPALAALVIDLTRQLSATRAAYHQAVALLHTRQRELKQVRARYVAQRSRSSDGFAFAR